MTLEGETLPELARKINIGVSRKLIFSHTRVLFINEEIAEEGFIRFLDSLDRSAQFRNDFNIMITRGIAAEKFVMITDPIEKIPSLKIYRQVKALVEEWGGDPQVRLTDFLNAITSKGRHPVVSAIKIAGDPEKGKSADANMSIEREARIVMDGLAVFKKDRLVGILTLEDTRNYVWTQDLKRTSITFPCDGQEEDRDKRRNVDLHIYNSKTKMKTFYRNNRPVLKLDIYAEATVAGVQCTKDLTKIDTYAQFEKKAEKNIKNRISETIKKVQSEYGLDIFGFGETLRRSDYKKFKKVEDHWDEEFAKGDVDITVRVQIRRAGTKSKSFLSEMPGT
jgi:spore germination protein KC